MKILLLQAVTVMQVGVKFMFSQDHDTLGILVVSILSLQVPVDSGYKRYLVNKDSTPITTFPILIMKVIQLLVANTDKCYNQGRDIHLIMNGCS
jgi:hypothetical protein